MKSRAQRYRYVRHVVSGTRPSPWSPLSLGSSLAQWDASDLSTLWQDTGKTVPAVADGDRVRVIADKSANGYDLVAPSDAGRGTLKLNIDGGRAVVRLADVAQYFEATIPAYTGTAVSAGGRVIMRSVNGLGGIIVMRNSVTDYNTLNGIGAVSNCIDDEGFPSGYRGGRQARGFHSLPVGKPINFLSVYDGANHTMYGDYGIAQPVVASTGAFAVNRVHVGGLWYPDATAGYPATVDICELVAMTAAVPAAGAVLLDTYLNSKWGQPTAPQLICDGDSLTFGTGASVFNTNYPYVLRNLLGSNWTHSNRGVSGKRGTECAADAPGRIDVNYRSTRTQNIVLGRFGNNDYPQGMTAAQLLALHVSYSAARRAVGFKYLPFTLLPGGVDAGFETYRSDFNTLLRAKAGDSDFPYGIVDVAADSRIGDAGDQADLTYFDADQVHQNDAGYAIVAAIAKTAIDAIL